MYLSCAPRRKYIRSRYFSAEHLRPCILDSPKISFCNYNLQRRPSALTRQPCWQMPFLVLRPKVGRLYGSALVSDGEAPPGGGLAPLPLLILWEKAWESVRASVSPSPPYSIIHKHLGFFIQSAEGIATLGSHWHIFCIRSLVFY